MSQAAKVSRELKVSRALKVIRGLKDHKASLDLLQTQVLQVVKARPAARVTPAAKAI